MIIGEETEFIEFKKTTGERKDAMNAICAILNKHCHGTLYFGINDYGYVVGQEVSDSTKKDLSRLIYDSVYPKITPTIDVLTIDNKKIIKVTFSGFNRPYSVYGDYLIRIGTENKKMSTDELKRLILHDDYASKWEKEMTNYKIDDIDNEALLDFYNASTLSNRLSMKIYDKEKLLTMLELYSNGYLNNAGNSLFGKNSNISLKLATYATDNKVTFTDLKLVNGNIYNLVNTAIKYILDRINWKIEITEMKRKETPEIPASALREIIVNAFAHTNYEIGNEIEIGIHPSKIEIYNPGTFPLDLTPYDFINNNLPSYRRNKIILDVLFRSKDVEKSGSGFQRVDELCNEFKIRWIYRKDAYGFFFEFDRNTKEMILINDFTKQELDIAKFIKENEKITKQELAMKIGKSEKTVQRIISKLMSKNIVLRVGSNKTGYWKINE